MSMRERFSGMTVVLALAGCPFGRSTGPDRVEQLKGERDGLRVEVEALTKRVEPLRAQTDGRLESVVGGGTALGFPGSDAAALRVEWSSEHAGHTLRGSLSPTGNGERTPASITVRR